MKKDIATNYLSNAYGSDVNAMMQLAQFTDLLDDVGRSDNPALTYDKLVDEMGIDPYAAHIISALPREDAFDVIDSNWKEAIDRNDRIAAMEKTDKDALQERNEAAYNLAFNTEDWVRQDALAAVIGTSAVADVVSDVGVNLALVRASSDGRNEIAMSYARDVIYDYLNEQNWMSPEQRVKLRKLTPPDGGTQFAQIRNDAVYSRNYLAAIGGNLTIQNLNTITSSITDEDFRALGKIILDEADSNVNEMSTLIKRNFRYNAQQQTIQGNDNLGKASKSAFEVVDLQLRMFAIDRKIEGNPPTLNELMVEKDRLISIQDTVFQGALRAEYEQTIDTFAQNYAGLPARIAAVGGGNAPLSTVITTIEDYLSDQNLSTSDSRYQLAMRTIDALRITYPGMNE
jgi:hypothetical protein